MKKRLVLVALSVLFVGGAVVAKISKSNVAPLSVADEALKKCRLHSTQLQVGTAPILYGDRGPVVDSPAAQRDFPNARSYVFGGCMVSPDSPGLQTVKFCPQCREAEKQWLLAYNRSIPAN